LTNQPFGSGPSLGSSICSSFAFSFKYAGHHFSVRSLNLDGAGEPLAEAEFVPPDNPEAAGVAIDLISTVHYLPSSRSDEEIVKRLLQIASNLVWKPYIAGGSTIKLIAAIIS
jgi:hypothetical protein